VREEREAWTRRKGELVELRGASNQLAEEKAVLQGRVAELAARLAVSQEEAAGRGERLGRAKEEVLGLRRRLEQQEHDASRREEELRAAKTQLEAINLQVCLNTFPASL
jgi:chromosome segregation ATPase